MCIRDRAGAADALPAAGGFEFTHPAMDAPALAADLLALYALRCV